jgi:phage-related minor tail protein
MADATGKTISVDDLFARATEILAAREKNYEEGTAIRDTLRNLRDAGMLGAAEVKKLEEMFPTRQRNRGDDKNGE